MRVSELDFNPEEYIRNEKGELFVWFSASRNVRLCINFTTSFRKVFDVIAGQREIY